MTEEISVEELRRIVVALHSYGKRLQQVGTDAHTGAGVEYLKLSDRLDKLVNSTERLIKIK